MKFVRFIMVVKWKGKNKKWIEEDIKPIPDNWTLREYCQKVVDDFNRTLRPGEEERELVGAIEKRLESIGENNEIKVPHQWEKVSIITEKGGYDNMRCKVCGIEGKRYGLGFSGVTIENKKFLKKYGFYCPGEK